MSFFGDLFGGADQAAKDQISGITAGLNQATQSIGQGSNALTSNYTAGLQPFLQNFATAGQGATQLGNVLGLNGPAGSQAALQTLQATPGFQFQLGQGNNAINAAAAANGTLGSGNQMLALANYDQGLASTTYNNYVNQLQPYLGMSSSAASGIGGMYGGLGNSLNADDINLANLQYGAQTSIGNANANAALSDQSLGLGLLGGALNLGMSSIPSNSLFGGLGKMLTFSDERLKEDIEPVGELYDGQKVYSYNYRGDPTPRIGLMAQEVEQRYPDAVREVGGFKAVDYGKATDMASELARFLEAA
ncbi:MAG: tail fiber domain-containing protein [Hyphomicrobiales bacterium]|nr:tail fiber domain-containing protein [Hyphomicrobiales bacterium]MBV8663470.1 tail fiber domain-containing protein [Hyphomicrobiales bacterium]